MRKFLGVSSFCAFILIFLASMIVFNNDAFAELFPKRSQKKKINMTFDDSTVFILLCHVRDENQNKLWRRCYDSIREFYLNTLVVIIDDNSPIPFKELSLKNTLVIRSEYPGAGELLPYYYYLEHEWRGKMIFLHDSMLLCRSFYPQELSQPIKFHWHFEHFWSNDERINSLLSFLPYSEELIDFNMNQKSQWQGCFGVASIIDLAILKEIEEKYFFTSIMKEKIKCREDRMALERIFALLMFKEQYVNKQNCSNFGPITSYPNWPYGAEGDALEELKLTYPGAILKTWQGR